MPLAWQMGAKTWQHPEAHKRFVEQEKAKAAAAKKSREEAKLAKEVEKEQRQLMRKQLVDQTRAQREAKKDEYLAQLKADVARLEMKRTGDTPERRIALFDKTRAAKQVEEREKEVGKEVELSALEMLALKEKELEEKHKEQRPKRFPGRPLSLLDDPEFWRLPDSDRHRLEIMPPEERVQYGFGPYEEDELENEPAPRQQFTGPTAVPESSEEQLAHRVRDFVFTADPSPPGMSATADEPITLSLPIEGIPDLSTLGAEDRRTAHLIVQDESKHLRDELARHAIEEFDANALVHFAESGLVPVEAEELVQAGFIYELRAQGVPARLSHAPHAPASAHKTRFNRPSHAGGVPHNPWGGPGPSNGNGGAGWHDEPLFGALGGGGAPGGHGGADWGAAGGIGGGHAGGWGAMGGTGGARNLPGAWASGATGGRGWAGGGAGAGGGHAGGGAVWHGLPKHPHTAGPSFRPAPHTQAPPELHSLPWGAQQYVKKVREQREREEREMTQASGARFATHLHPTAHAHAAAHPLPVEDPALFGSAFLHPSYATSPRPHGLPHASSHPLPARAETQRAMVDPDDGGAGGPPGPTGLGAGATPAAAALPTAPAAAAPAAAKGWDGLTGWLTGAGRGGAAAEAAPVPQAGAADDLRAGQPW